MEFRAYRRRFGVFVLSAATMLLSAWTARASDIILPGFDLFDPLSGSQMFLPVPIGDLVPFVGVPLGSFDFGSGPVATGTTDTIVRRLETATDADPMINIQLVAMQMVSVLPIDAGLGIDFHYVTLQAGPSLGTMTFAGLAGPHAPPPPPHGTVTYDALSINWELHKGSLVGPVAMVGTTVVSTGPVSWSHFAPPGTLLIPGVNYLLDGTSLKDYFPLEPFAFSATDGTTILVATAPEPGAAILVIMSGIALAMRGRRQHRR
jgi:hypothetical protein